MIRTLLDRELITGVGRGEGVGRPVLYGTTTRFMEHFGLASLDDLPRPEELPVVLRERGGQEEAGAGESGEPVAAGREDAAADADAAVSGDERTGGRQSPGDAPSDPEAALAAVLAHASGKPEDTGE